jgi:hypothetical protein
MIWEIQNFKKGSTNNHVILKIERHEPLGLLEEVLNPGDLITYDRYQGEKLKIISINDNLIEIVIPDNFDSKKYLQKGIKLFKIKD